MTSYYKESSSDISVAEENDQNKEDVGDFVHQFSQKIEK
jgi:hypothetical protein